MGGFPTSAPVDTDVSSSRDSSSRTPPSAFEAFAIQSPSNGDEYAGGMSYDAENDVLYLAGSTYSNPFSHDGALTDDLSCFVSKMDMNSHDIVWNQFFKSVETASGSRGEGSRAACSTMSHIGGHGIPIGHIEKSSVVVSFDDEIIVQHSSTGPRTVTGFVLGLDEFNPVGVVSGKVLAESEVNYPLAITRSNIGDEGEGVIVASIITDEDEVNMDFSLTKEEETEGRGADPNSGVFKYGSIFQIQLQKYLYDSERNHFTESWSRIYGSEEKEDVRVSDVISFGDNVIFSGTTASPGSMFGGENPVTSKDLDGFVTKLTGNGRIPQDGTYTTRIAADAGDNEVMSSMCVSKREGASSLYVVGSTTGMMDPTFDNYYSVRRHDMFYAFLIKLDVDTLKIMWTRQIGSYGPSKDVFGVGCAVTDDDETVYLTGVVTNGGTVLPTEDDKDRPSAGHGGDDVFIVSYDTLNGNQHFIRQVGSDQNDILARGSGSVYTDDRGNAIIYGTTRGQIYRTDKFDDDADLFLIQFQRNTGDYKKPPNATTSNITQTLTDPQFSKNTPSIYPPIATRTSSYIGAFVIALVSSLTLIICIIAYNYGANKTKQKYESELQAARQQNNDDDYGIEFAGHRLRYVKSPTPPEDVEVVDFDYATQDIDGVHIVDDYVEMNDNDNQMPSTYDDLLSSLDSIGGLALDREPTQHHTDTDTDTDNTHQQEHYIEESGYEQHHDDDYLQQREIT